MLYLVRNIPASRPLGIKLPVAEGTLCNLRNFCLKISVCIPACEIIARSCGSFQGKGFCLHSVLARIDSRGRSHIMICDAIFRGFPQSIEIYDTIGCCCQIFDCSFILIDHAAAFLGTPAGKVIVFTGKSIFSQRLFFIIYKGLIGHFAGGCITALIEPDLILVGLPQSDIGYRLRPHNRLNLRFGFAVQCPVPEVIADTHRIRRLIHSLSIVGGLGNRYCVLITRIKRQVTEGTFVVDLDDSLSVTGNLRDTISHLQAFDRHVFIDDAIAVNVSFIGGFAAVHQRISQICRVNQCIRKCLILLEVLQYISAVLLLHIIFNTVLRIGLQFPHSGIGQILRTHHRCRSSRTPARKPIALGRHLRCSKLGSIFEIIDDVILIHDTRIEGHGMTLHGIVVIQHCAAVSQNPEFLCLRNVVTLVTLHARRHISIGSTFKLLDLCKLILTGSIVFLIMLHSIRNIRCGIPLGINIGIRRRHDFREGIGFCQFLVAVPATKGITKPLRIFQRRDLVLVFPDNHGQIAAAIAVGHDHISGSQRIPVQGNPSLNRFGSKGQRLVPPGDNHFTAQHLISFLRMHLNGIGVGIVSKLLVGHGNYKITITFIVVNLTFHFTLFQIQGIHTENIIRNYRCTDVILQFDLRHLTLGHHEVKYTLPLTYLQKQPFLIHYVGSSSVSSTDRFRTHIQLKVRTYLHQHGASVVP